MQTFSAEATKLVPWESSNRNRGQARDAMARAAGSFFDDSTQSLVLSGDLLTFRSVSECLECSWIRICELHLLCFPFILPHVFRFYFHPFSSVFLPMASFSVFTFVLSQTASCIASCTVLCFCFLLRRPDFRIGFGANVLWFWHAARFWFTESRVESFSTLDVVLHDVRIEIAE